MKIIVDNLPIDPKECPFSEWYPFGIGCFKCRLVNKACDLFDRENESECRILKEIDE